jgi:DNA polymerase-3 subunit beta
MIERTAFAITTEDHRYSLNGALCLVRAGSVTFVATDGHRLAFVSQKVDVKPPKGDDLKSIVPRKALTQLAHLAAEEDPGNPVKLGRAGNQMFFGVGSHVLTTTLLEGQFPEFEKVMPKSCDTTLVLPTADIGDALRRVSLLSSDRHTRAIQFSLSEGKLDLSSETEMGRAEETLAVDYAGADVAIGFNAKYLLDFLGVVGTGAVALELNPSRADESGAARTGDKPGLLRPHDGGDLEYKYVVMPMQL